MHKLNFLNAYLRDKFHQKKMKNIFLPYFIQSNTRKSCVWSISTPPPNSERQIQSIQSQQRYSELSIEGLAVKFVMYFTVYSRIRMETL